MDIQVLGPVSVRAHGHFLRLPRGHARTVLAVLALHHPELVSHDRLIDVAWNGRNPTTVTTQLHGIISTLRRALSRDAIETHGSAYLLRVDAARLDLAVFNAALDNARAAAGRGNHAEASVHYRTALDAWRGVAFEGIDSPYLSWHANRLEQVRTLAVEEWAKTELTLGRHAAAANELLDWWARDPLRESLCELAMTALYRAGRQAHALATFRETGTALRATLAVEPGPDLQRLHRRILAADPSLLADRSASVTQAPRQAVYPSQAHSSPSPADEVSRRRLAAQKRHTDSRSLTA